MPLPPPPDYPFDVDYFVSKFVRAYREGQTRYIQPGSQRCEAYVLAPLGKAPYKRGLTSFDVKPFVHAMRDRGYPNASIQLVKVRLGICCISKSKGVYGILFDEPSRT